MTPEFLGNEIQTRLDLPDLEPLAIDIPFAPVLDATLPIKIDLAVGNTDSHVPEGETIQVTIDGVNHTYKLLSPDQRVSEFVASLTPPEAQGSLTLVNSAGEYVDSGALLSSYQTIGNTFELQSVTGVWRNEQRVTLSPDVCREITQKFETLRESTNEILDKNPSTLPASPRESLSFGTLCHCLKEMMSSKNKEILLFDSRNENPFFKTIIDQGHQISRLEEEDIDIVSFRFKDLSLLGYQETSLQKYLESSTLENLKKEFTTYFSDKLHMSPEKVSQMEIISGSVIVNLNAQNWTLNERNNFIDLGSNIPHTTITIHPLFKSCTIDIAIFDRRGDKTNFHGGNFNLGPKNLKKTYYQPQGGHGWSRFGLAVLGKYSDGDGWLEPFESEKNWWRAYHGSTMAGVEGIVKNGTKDGMIRDSLGGKLNKGVYVTPHLEYASCYAQPCELDNRRYILVFQCAVEPGAIMAQGYPGSNSFKNFPHLSKIFQERYKDEDSEWTLPSKCVRPYGILVGDVDQLEKIYGKNAVGHRKAQRTQQPPLRSRTTQQTCCVIS